MRTCRSLPALGVGLLALLASDARAEFLVFRDGFILQGTRVRQQGTPAPDPGTGQIYILPTGDYALDTGPSFVFFPARDAQLADFIAEGGAGPGDLVTLRVPALRGYGPAVPPVTRVLGATDFDRKWERKVRVELDGGANGGRRRVEVPQRLGLLTPRLARVDSGKYRWSAFYPVQELGPTTVRSLLATHPETRAKEGDPAPRWRVYRFFAQAGWYDEAGRELADIARQFSGEQGKVAEARQDLQRLRTQRLYDDIQLAHQAGRHRWAQQQLTAFPRAGVEDKLAAGVRALKGEYAAANEQLEAARRLLQDLPPHLLPGPRRALGPAAAAILEELTYENVGRLEPFLTFARQAERAQAAGKPAQDPPELLALAATGWLLGMESAEAKVEAARRLWEARAFVLKYEQTADDGDRAKLLAAYRGRDPVGVDEMAQVIAHLPPPQPEKLGGGVTSLQADVPGGRRKPAQYLLKLPPEYHPGRPWPVVVALHQGGEKPEAMIERLAEEAGRHGYLLAAPEWERDIEGAYRYTAEEHAAVLETVRDLRQRFAVDSDRVFLLGAGEGGTMAYDVGLSHPDWFAGVVPVSGQPKLFAERYLPNAQLLPFYAVDGDRSGDLTKQNRLQFKAWIAQAYPALYVSYKGRGVEWFGAEVPTIFDWMDHKKDRFRRATGVPALGHAEASAHQAFQTMRQTDNRFYWLSTDAVRQRHVADPKQWRASVIAATMQGSVRDGNQIAVRVSGLEQLTVWLSRDMIDFGKPVVVRINGRAARPRKVAPSMETMLEDFYQRGDRQRLYGAKLEFDRP